MWFVYCVLAGTEFVVDYFYFVAVFFFFVLFSGALELLSVLRAALREL